MSFPRDTENPHQQEEASNDAGRLGGLRKGKSRSARDVEEGAAARVANVGSNNDDDKRTWTPMEDAELRRLVEPAGEH